MFAYKYRFKICDPVHGFIRFDEIEKKIIDSRPFQRLRYIRQMGVAYLVYPGATHTRFEHSLGVMEVATRIYDNLFKEKAKPVSDEDLHYWRQVLRAASLCHDMGHLPFSHTAEKSLLPKGGHEQKTVEFIQSQEMQEIWNELKVDVADVIKLSVGEKGETLTPWERLLSQIITDDNFGADRIDYLIRDSRFTGVGYGLFDFHQLIDSLRLAQDVKNQDLLTIGCLESGLQSVESLWVARYLMYSRVYHHRKCHVYTLHMNRFMKNYYLRKGLPKTIESYLHQTDSVILSALEAQNNDYDAKVLQMQASSFEPFEIDDSQIESFAKKFGNDVFIDNLSSTHEKERNFSVLMPDGQVRSSTELSEFLRNIPLGARKIGLFVDPLKKQEMLTFLHGH